MIENREGIEPGVAAAEHVTQIDVEVVLVSGAGVPGAFARDLDVVGAAADQ